MARIERELGRRKEVEDLLVLPRPAKRVQNGAGFSGKTCFIIYLPYLSSIHEKANCIAILWTKVRTRLGVAFFEVFMGHLSST